MTDACVESADETTAVDDGDDRDDEHLRDVPVGAGCTEIWEHLSDHREE